MNVASVIDGGIRANRLRGLRALVAEDDADSRELLRHVLTSHGATCTVASSGNEAFQAFMQQRPDVLIADVWMQDGDGFDLIRHIRSMTPEQGGLIPAIAVSARANAEQALMEGYHVLVPKPIDPDSIVRVVEEFVRAESEAPSAASCWSVSSPSPGIVVMAFTGYAGAADVREAMAVLLAHLQVHPCKIVVDMRRLTGFSVAAASVAQRALWPRRNAILHMRFVGGSLIARSVASATCRLLGIGCTVHDGEDAPTL